MQAEGEMRAEAEVIRLPERADEPPDFTAFFADEHARLFKALYFVTGNRADAQEIMQDTFLKLWERWDRVTEIEDLTAYLFRVALNGSRMRARAARRAVKRLRVVSEEVEPFAEIDLREDVARMLRSLAPRQRAALVLLDMYGYGSDEAARIMQIRPSTVRALATQGRAVLRTTGGPHA
jgi:RNA polymerase sigma factor (sigma-70 family)